MEKTINLKTQINRNWKEFFRKYTNASDVARISVEYGIGYHTLHNIRICNGNVGNEKNNNALNALAKVAIENAKFTIKEAQEDVMSMENYISEIIDKD